VRANVSTATTAGKATADSLDSRAKEKAARENILKRCRRVSRKVRCDSRANNMKSDASKSARPEIQVTDSV
jgi:hypothetical protein